MSPLTALTKFFSGSRSAKPSRRKAPSRRLGVESLEKRQVMAGNVVAAVMGGNLNLIGGSLDNQVVVSEVRHNVFKVEGFSGTTVNGRNNGTFYAANDRLIVKLGAGNDTLIVASDGSGSRRTDLSSINVDMGQGNDNVYLWSITVNGGGYSTIINMGDDDRDIGSDRFEMGAVGNHYATSIGQSMSLRMGGGNDVARFQGATKVGRFLGVSMGDGHDSLEFNRLHVGRLDANLGYGNDTVHAWGLYAQSMDVNGGNGYDTYHGPWNSWKPTYVYYNFNYVNPK